MNGSESSFRDKFVLHPLGPNKKFEKAWKDCYIDERCSIVHGRGSRLIDISKIPEHEELVKIVHFWTRGVIYYFIECNQSV